MIIKSKAGTEIAKNGYTVIDELNQIPMIKTNYLQLEHNHINPIIIGSKAFEHKDIFVNVVEDTETSGNTAFKEYNAIHEFAWILSGMRKHDSYTGYLSLEQYLTMVLKDTDFTYQVEGGHQYYALQFENLGDGESHLDMFFKMLNRWNTEFELRGKKVYITHQRGRLRDKHVGRYKMNIIDTIINSDITDGATAVWGYFGKKDEENPENSTYREFYWQIDELVEQYGIRYAKPYSNENITQEETMIEYLNNIILDSWKISTEVDIAEITDEVVQTGNEYVAVDERLGITLNTRIQKLESVYDVDDKLLYQTATLGTVSFASAASGSSNQLQEVIEKIKKDYSERITDLKQEFDNRFNDEVTQIEIEFNELVNGVRQEIKTDKEAFELQYEADKEALSGEIRDSYTNAVTEANRIVEAKEIDFKNYADGIGSTANGRIDDLYEGFGDLSSEFESLNFENRNLIRNSNLPKTSTSYLVTRYDLTTDWEDNVTYTLTIKGSTNRELRVWRDIGLAIGYIGTLNELGSGLYSLTFTTKNYTGSTRNIISVYNGVNDGSTKSAQIEWIKLEKGSKATDWTPAPEDTDQKLTIIANDLDGIQTKVENNTGAITTVTQQANGLERRVKNAEGDITTVTELANGTQQRVTNAEGNINTITNLANGTQQTVTNMLNGTATKGTVFQNTVDGFLNRVWQTDIDKLNFENRNLLLNSNNYIDNVSRAPELIIDGKTYRQIGYIWRCSFDVKLSKGTEYTISIPVYNDSDEDSIAKIFGFFGNNTKVIKPKEKILFSVTGTANEDIEGKIYFLTEYGRNPLYFSYAKLELGNKATPWSPAPEDLMKYTDIVARPDGFLIGTFEMGGDKIAQAIVGKSGAIDLIAQNVNFTGNVNVANQIKAYSLEAVYADIAKLRTNILTANSVEANALKVDTALINKLNTNSILTNYLIADTAMIENIKSKSLEAVYANISELRTRMLVANVITANMVKFDTALIEKFTSSTAFINSLTAKSAFISNVKAIDIDFNRATATGGSGDSSLLITGDEIIQAGSYERTWRGKTDFIKGKTVFQHGYMRIRNDNQNRSLYYGADGISTYVDGGDYDSEDGRGISSGSIFFFDREYANSNAKGMTLNSTYGAISSVSDTNIIVLHPQRERSNNFFHFTKSNDGKDLYIYNSVLKNSGGYTRGAGLRLSEALGGSVEIVDKNAETGGSTKIRAGIAHVSTMMDYGSLVFKPFENDFGKIFRMTKSDDKKDGYILFGFENGNQMGLRFEGTKVGNISVVNKDNETGGDTIFQVGNVRANTVVKRDGSYQVYWNGTSGGNMFGSNYTEGLTLMATGVRARDGDDNMYLGVDNEVRVTSKRGYNDGSPNYKKIKFSQWEAVSHEKYKYDIEQWDISVLDIFKHELELSRYKLISEKKNDFVKFHHGIVIRELPQNDKFPIEWRNGDGFNGNEVMWWTVKGVQELAHENDTLKDRINDLENKLNKIMEMIV